MKHYVTIDGRNVSRRWLKKHPEAYPVRIVSTQPWPPRRPPVIMPKPIPQNRLGLSEEARELFVRMWAQVAKYEASNGDPIYELAIKIFPLVYGVMPCDVERFQVLRNKVAAGEVVPLFDSPNTKSSRVTAQP